jgi:Family of unknown function (DUF6167)
VAGVSRAIWFAAGLASGVYGVFKIKRTIENLTPVGIGARVAAVRRGAQVFADEVSAAARERETELLAELRASAANDRLLPAAEAPAIPAPRRAARPTDRHSTRESVTDGNR